MEIWLFANNYTEKLQLPVNPVEITIKTGNKNTVVDIQALGEANLIGNAKLADVEIASFFPAHYASYCAYLNIPDKWEAVKLINKWKSERKPIRLYITDAPINLACAIEDFTYGLKGGSDDVYYTLVLKEYRQLDIPAIGTTNRPELMVAP